MTPSETNWLVFSASGVPFWLMLVGAAAALYAAHRWLAVERRGRSHPAARWLPWTLSLLLGLVACLVWRPVAVKITAWEQAGRVVMVVDPSLSMATPLVGDDLSVQLDLLGLWHPEALTGRNTAARQLADQLGVLAGEVNDQRLAAAEFEAEIAQGVPPGATSRELLAGYPEWPQNVRARLHATISRLPVHDEPAIDGLAKAAGLQAESLNPPRPAIVALQSLAEAISAATPAAGRIQTAVDRTFRDQHAADLDPLLAELRQRTRSDAVQWVTGTNAATQAEAAETDLYELLEAALSQPDAERISHLVLLSDGGQNGSANARVLERLQREGVGLVVVGVGGAAGKGVDLAVRDWQAPRLLRADRSFQVTAQLKTATGGAELPLRLRLTASDVELGAGEFTSNGSDELKAILTAKALPAGRHVLRLAVESDRDLFAANDAVEFVVDAVERDSGMLLLGNYPDWDTTYLAQAAERQGIPVTQIFTAGKELQRGRGSGAMPSSLDQWARYQAVILTGPVLTGFTEQDAADLHQFVVAKGGALMVFSAEAGGYRPALASLFGWTEPSGTGRGVLRLGNAARDLQMVRLGSDGAQSARRFAALGPPAAAWPVPPQQVLLIESEPGTPVASLGTYGQGKVIFWGLKGLYRLREYERAQAVNRLLDGLIGELVAPSGAAVYQSPGLERIFWEFNEPFLRDLAGRARAEYLPVTGARAGLDALQPRTEQVKTAQVFHLGSHWLLLVAVALTGTVHWALRKLAGLAI